jgi:hypothetical protein
MSTKICSKCKLEKPLVDFHASKLGKFGKRGECKSCGNAYMRQRPTKRAAGRRSTIRRYGLELEQFNKLRVAQKFACAICGLPESSNLHGVLYIDHSHETHKVRGLLCLECNNGLGKFRDNPALLARAIEYLKE